MFSGFFLLAFAALFWFEIAKDTSEKSSTRFVWFFKKVFGVKGFVYTAKALALFMFAASLLNFYKYFFGAGEV